VESDYSKCGSVGVPGRIKKENHPQGEVAVRAEYPVPAEAILPVEIVPNSLLDSRFFEPVRGSFSRCKWRHLQFVVLALGAAWARRSWASVYRLVDGGPWHQKMNDFMTRAPWGRFAGVDAVGTAGA